MAEHRSDVDNVYTTSLQQIVLVGLLKVQETADVLLGFNRVICMMGFPLLLLLFLEEYLGLDG